MFFCLLLRSSGKRRREAARTVHAFLPSRCWRLHRWALTLTSSADTCSLKTPELPRSFTSPHATFSHVSYDFYQRPLSINVRLHTSVNSFSSGQISKGRRAWRVRRARCARRRHVPLWKWHIRQMEDLPQVMTVFAATLEEP